MSNAEHNVQTPSASLPQARLSQAQILARWPQSFAYRAVQRGLTWVSGIPLPGQTFRRRSAIEPYATAFAELAVSGTASVALTTYIGETLMTHGLQLSLIPALLAAVPLTVSLAGQKNSVPSVLVHWGTHGHGLPNSVANRWVPETLAVLTLTVPFDAYREDHNGAQGHHSRVFATARDPDGKLVMDWGFRPGMSRKALWRRYWLNWISPRFHGRLIRSRLKLAFLYGSPERRSLAAAIWLALLGVLLATSPWWAIAGYLAPVLIAGNVSSMTQLLSEHRWFGEPQVQGLRRHIALSHARFLADPIPEKGGLIAWLRWTARLVFLHIPARIGALREDLSNHDAHHAGAFDDKWLNARQYYGVEYAARMEAEGRAYYSIGAAIEAGFKAIESAEALDADSPKLKH